MGRVRNVWNAFLGRDPTPSYSVYRGASSGIDPSMPRFGKGNAKSIVAAIYNRIAVDCASVDISHVRLNKDGQFKEVIDDSLNEVLQVEANIDQTGRDLIRDIVISMLDEGVVAVVPYEMNIDPDNTEAYKVSKVRTARITQWYPKHIQVEIYNEERGIKQQLIFEKRICAIVENPFFTVMNEPNSISQRLIRVLNQLDRTNEQNSGGKLDLIIQLPYVVKGPTQRFQAETRRKDIEAQLTGAQYGIAYIDGTEKIVQLNRSIENNLWEQAKDLMTQLFDQLGFSNEILNGTANEQTMLNYTNQIIAPILTAITEEMERKWLTKTARSQNQAIRFFNKPFKLVPVAQLAEIADKFTRNEIMTSNEFRSVVGLQPSDDPKADELRNANLNHPDEEGTTSTVIDEVVKEDSPLKHHEAMGEVIPFQNILDMASRAEIQNEGGMNNGISF